MFLLRARKIFKLIVGAFNSMYSPSHFSIKKGYKHRKKYSYYNDSANTDSWQNEVYQLAKDFADDNNLKKIIDVGCGSAYKLLHHFGENFEITGLDVDETIDKLNLAHPNHKWLNGLVTDYSKLDGDLVICSDVIEHVLNPTELINNIKQITNAKYLCISTPDRLILNGSTDFGPPKNKTHIREWTGKEFKMYLTSLNLTVISQQISNYDQCTQLIFCKI
jgi:2-polyprenyl-3-methyl-5-hydroxy-6-metoxy-1,4-benzoquinol methylase